MRRSTPLQPEPDADALLVKVTEWFLEHYAESRWTAEHSAKQVLDLVSRSQLEAHRS